MQPYRQEVQEFIRMTNIFLALEGTDTPVVGGRTAGDLIVSQRSDKTVISSRYGETGLWARHLSGAFTSWSISIFMRSAVSTTPHQPHTRNEQHNRHHSNAYLKPHAIGPVPTSCPFSGGNMLRGAGFPATKIFLETTLDWTFVRINCWA